MEVKQEPEDIFIEEHNIKVDEYIPSHTLTKEKYIYVNENLNKHLVIKDKYVSINTDSKFYSEHLEKAYTKTENDINQYRSLTDLKCKFVQSNGKKISQKAPKRILCMAAPSLLTPPTAEAGVPAPTPIPTRSPPQNTQAPSMTRAPTTGQLSLPFLRGQTLITFGRRDSDYRTRQLELGIDNQVTLSGMTYDKMMQLTTVDLPIDRDNFIRMWKTIILKRAQDIYEQEYHIRADNYVRVMKNITIPATLADLLYSLGQIHSQARGFIYNVVPPPRPAQMPVWWQLDPEILQAFQLTCNRMKNFFMMKKYPQLSDYTNKSLSLVRVHDHAQMRSIKCYTNEPLPSDACIAMVNDDLFPGDHNLTYDECSFRMVESLHRPSVINEYISSYVFDSNA